MGDIVNIVEIISGLIKDDFGLTPRIGAEIEFYFTAGDNEEATDNQCLTNILEQCKQENIIISGLNFENGQRQYEFALSAVNNASIIAQHLDRLKEIINDETKKHSINTSFAAKPYDNQPGSAIHIHISLENSAHENLFQKPHDNHDATNTIEENTTRTSEQNTTNIIEADNESKQLLYCVGGMLELMPQSMIFFAPNEDSYKRFTAKNNDDIPDDKPLQRYNNAPINISWGNNNRSTALRIPSCTNRQNERHIEHRVAGADADPHEIITAILAAIHYGLSNKITPPNKIYGNAFDKQYNCPALPNKLEIAQSIAKNDDILKTYMAG